MKLGRLGEQYNPFRVGRQLGINYRMSIDLEHSVCKTGSKQSPSKPKPTTVVMVLS